MWATRASEDPARAGSTLDSEPASCSRSASKRKGRLKAAEVEIIAEDIKSSRISGNAGGKVPEADLFTFAFYSPLRIVLRAAGVVKRIVKTIRLGLFPSGR